VPLHPLEDVVVRGAITETVLLIVFATYILPLFGLKAIPSGAGPTRMVAITTPSCGLFSVTLYVIGNGGVN